MAKKKADILVEKLQKAGWNEISSKSRKYRIFVKKGEKYKYFVGRHGALRKGKNVSNSISLTRMIW